MRHRSATKASSYLHRAIRAAGVSLFDAALITEGRIEELAGLEIMHIASRRSAAPAGYNLTNGGGVIHTEAHTAERRAKAADTARRTHLGVKRSAETRARLSAALTGRTYTEKQRAAHLKNITGRAMSDATRAAIRASRERATLVWYPGALLAVEYPTLGAAIEASGQPASTVKLCLREGRAMKSGHAFAYL